MRPENETEDLKIPSSFDPPRFEDTVLAKLPSKPGPCKPLLPPVRRAALLVLLALAFAAASLAWTGWKGGVDQKPWVLAFVPPVLEIVAGAVSFWLAMCWSVPGSAVHRGGTFTFWGCVFALLLAAALAAPHFVPATYPGLHVGPGPSHGIACLGWELLVAVPVLAVAFWMIGRAAPVSSALAGGLAGLGAGMVSDAAIHFRCGAVDPWHTVPWHLGAIALLACLGALSGKLLPRW